MPVQLTRASSGAPLRGRVYDVSSDGLCLRVGSELTVGTHFVYATALETFGLVVVWVRQDGEGAWRAGLRLAPDRGDLTAVFAGFLASRRFSADP